MNQAICYKTNLGLPYISYYVIHCCYIFILIENKGPQYTRIYQIVPRRKFLKNQFNTLNATKDKNIQF